MSDGEPGYRAGCGTFHLLTPVPEWGGGACRWCIATRRLDPPEPGGRHVCNTGDRLKPGHPVYRRCGCGQWFHSGGGYWYRVDRPPVRWLREHGADPGEFWSLEDEDGAAWFEEAGPGRPRLRVFLSWLFHGKRLPACGYSRGLGLASAAPSPGCITAVGRPRVRVSASPFTSYTPSPRHAPTVTRPSATPKPHQHERPLTGPPALSLSVPDHPYRAWVSGPWHVPPGQPRTQPGPQPRARSPSRP